MCTDSYLSILERNESLNVFGVWPALLKPSPILDQNGRFSLPIFRPTALNFSPFSSQNGKHRWPISEGLNGRGGGGGGITATSKDFALTARKDLSGPERQNNDILSNYSAITLTRNVSCT